MLPATELVRPRWYAAILVHLTNMNKYTQVSQRGHRTEKHLSDAETEMSDCYEYFLELSVCLRPTGRSSSPAVKQSEERSITSCVRTVRG